VQAQGQGHEDLATLSREVQVREVQEEQQELKAQSQAQRQAPSSQKQREEWFGVNTHQTIYKKMI